MLQHMSGRELVNGCLKSGLLDLHYSFMICFLHFKNDPNWNMEVPLFFHVSYFFPKIGGNKCVVGIWIQEPSTLKASYQQHLLHLTDL